MKQGIIARLLDYYYSEPIFKGEIIRATEEFFGFKAPGEAFSEGVETDVINGLFNEWLVYDFKMKNGKTLLEDFCEFNPLDLPEIEFRDYREILENKFAMFEVLKVRWHRGLELRDLQTGNEYWVKEKLGTEQAKPGYIFFGRVGKVGDHWELIGADGPALPMKIEKGAREYFHEMKDALSPKEVYNVFYKKSGEEKPERYAEKDPKKAKDSFQLVLKKLELGSLISAETVKKWIENNICENNPAGYASLIYGLLDKRKKYGKDNVDELAAAFSDFHNTIAQKMLNNTSPNELKSRQKGGEADWRFNITPVGAGEWEEYQYEAHEYFIENDPGKAMEYYNKCFESLLKNKAAEREIYRTFANKAVTHFQLGEENEGVRLLEMALELNPNYDFARNMMKKYKEGGFADTIMAGMLVETGKRMKDPDHFLNKWNYDEIKNKWSVEKILAKLEEYGIKADKNQFRENAKRLVSVEELSKKYLHPFFKGKDNDEDFVWMATYGLWRQWCEDIPSVEFFSEKIEKFWETVFEEDDFSVQKIEKKLEYFEKTAEKMSSEFSERWKKAGEYYFDIINLCSCLCELVGSKFEERALKLSVILRKKTGNDYFFLADVCSKAYYNEGWEEKSRKLNETMPYEYRIYLETARVFNRLENRLLEERNLEEALAVVQKREQDKIYDLEYSKNTIYEDYEDVLDQLKDFYKGNKNKLANIRNLKKEIRNREDELLKSEKNKSIEKRMIEFETEMFKKRFKNDPANQYFQFLKKMEINFATDQLTKSNITIIGMESKRKIGRNDPCPCNSGKKFKRCCGA